MALKDRRAQDARAGSYRDVFTAFLESHDASGWLDSSMIELRGICRDYAVGDQTVHALDQVDLAIASGEYISIMGPSGSGKST